MHIVCPSCGARHSAEAWANDPLIRQSFAVMAQFPNEISKNCLSYIALFRPTSGRGLSWGKVHRLLVDLQKLSIGPSISWKQKPARPNHPSCWGLAMERMIQKPPEDLPLENHQYLRSVAYGIADQMDKDNEKRVIVAERGVRVPGPARQEGRDNFIPSKADFAQLMEKIKGGKNSP